MICDGGLGTEKQGQQDYRDQPSFSIILLFLQQLLLSKTCFMLLSLAGTRSHIVWDNI